MRHQILDYSPGALIAEMDGAVASLDRLLRGGHTVYLHCTAGINRSPTIAVAYLVRHGGQTLKEALEVVTRARPQAQPYVEALTVLRGSAG